ncbi:MAG: tetratricopeptide repeat protein [bacterium]|nr:tetratricopeptide repeat protein [bacterium]
MTRSRFWQVAAASMLVAMLMLGHCAFVAGAPLPSNDVAATLVSSSTAVLGGAANQTSTCPNAAVADYYEKLARRAILNDDTKSALRYFACAFSNDQTRVRYLKEIAGLHETAAQDPGTTRIGDQHLAADEGTNDPACDQRADYVRGLLRSALQDAQSEGANEPVATYNGLLDEGARYMRDDSLDYERARQAYQKAIALDPKVPNAYYNLGLVYLRLTNFVQSIPCFEKALEQDATFADAHLALGMAYERQRDNARASEHYQLYLEVAPQGAHADAVRDWVTRHAGTQ